MGDTDQIHTGSDPERLVLVTVGREGKNICGIESTSRPAEVFGQDKDHKANSLIAYAENPARMG